MHVAALALAKVTGALGLSGAAAGASAGATAAAGAASAGASIGSTLLTGAQVLTSAVSALGTLKAGMEAARADRQAADQADLEQGQEKVQSEQRVSAMKRSLLQVLGENDVTFAAAGIDISGGIAEGARKSATDRATSELSIERRDTDFRRALLRTRAAGLRRRASSQQTTGLLGALGQAGNAAIDIAQRG